MTTQAGYESRVCPACRAPVAAGANFCPRCGLRIAAPSMPDAAAPADDERPVWSVAYSPDGGTLASGHGDGGIRLWRAADGALLHDMPGHEGTVRSVAWQPDGQRLASAGADGMIRLWRPDGAPLHTLAVPQESQRSKPRSWLRRS